MDIKLKRNKRISLLLAGMIAAAAAVGFMAFYPAFKQGAESYNQQSEDRLMKEYLPEKLLWGNYVLYKDMAEKAEGERYSYEELYLRVKEAPASKSYVNTPDSYIDGEIFTEDIKAFLAELFRNERASVMNEICQKMDYCVIDGKSGEFIKNTGNNIEALAGKNAEETDQLPYVYYVVMTYDSAGNPGNVSVKGRDSDILLKNVQHIMKSNLIEDNMYENYGTGKSFYYYTDESNELVKRVIYDIGSPRDVTFIYALTQEQQNLMLGEDGANNTIFYTSWDDVYAYRQSGVTEIYAVFIAGLTAIMFVLLCNRRYCLYQYRIFRLSVEIGAVAGVLLIVLSGEAAVNLVNYTNRGNFYEIWRRYLTFLPEESLFLVTGAVNVIILTFMFGGWIYLINTLGDIKVLGIKGYFKERSILIRICTVIRHGIDKFRHGFKDELLHTDLGEKTERVIRKLVIVNAIVLAVICGMWFFGWITLIIYSVLLYFALKKYISKLKNQYRRLLQATGSIAEGNLNTEFNEDLGVFESYKEQLHRIQEGFRKAVYEEVKSQRMKAELITNVSHDLKTPLTAITTYIDLLKEDNVTEAQRQEYIKVLEKKSLRLKLLIEDLFEVSKANSKNVTITLVDVDICNLIRQVYLEHEDRAAENNLIFRFRLPENKIILKLDSEKTYRIIENLFTNIIKYAMHDTRVYVNAEVLAPSEKEETSERVVIELKNISAAEIQTAGGDLAERFVRGDSSRNTEGSGLGLAIARSFTELQGGSMDVTVDGDLFKVTLELPLSSEMGGEI